MNTAVHQPLTAGSPALQAMPEQEVDNLIYIISHDVRNSVRALIEIPQWIQEDIAAGGTPVDPDLRTNLDMLTTHASRLDRMMHDLLVFSRVGRMQEMREVDLSDIVENVLSQIALPRTARVETMFEVPAVMLGERDILTLLAALISNSLRHHDGDTATISLGSRAAGDTVILTVEDDGPGIAPEYRERVFDPMHTLRPRDEVEGSGMGLAIARKIVRTYGGSISVGSGADDRGTRVEVRLPLRRTVN